MAQIPVPVPTSMIFCALVSMGMPRVQRTRDLPAGSGQWGLGRVHRRASTSSYGDYQSVIRIFWMRGSHRRTSNPMSSMSLCVSSLGALRHLAKLQAAGRVLGEFAHQYSVVLKFSYVLPCNSRYCKILEVTETVKLPL
jgi:hypothetical protein